jgi:hypothetical protein
MNNFIKKPTTVKVGHNIYRIFREFDQSRAVIQVISTIVIKDEESGEEKIFYTPTPGWKYKKYN